MILELARLMDGNYFFVRQSGDKPFYGSRIELLEYLHTCGYGDTEIDLIMRVLDNMQPVNLPASRQGYC